jgi:hypothetical protein
MARLVCEVCGEFATSATVDLRKISTDIDAGQTHIVWAYDGDPYLLRCNAHARGIGITETARITRIERRAEEERTGVVAEIPAEIRNADLETEKARLLNEHVAEMDRTAEAAQASADAQATVAQQAADTADAAVPLDPETVVTEQPVPVGEVVPPEQNVPYPQPSPTGEVLPEDLPVSEQPLTDQTPF